MNDMQSILFYVSCFLISGLFLHLGRKKKFSPFVIIGLLIPIVIGGLRYDVGTDYMTYIDNIALLNNLPLSVYVSDFSSYLEPTFYIFASIANFFHYPNLVFFIYSAVSVLFFYKALHESRIKYVALAYVLFLLIMFPMSFNLVRQFAAVSIAVYAVVKLYNGDKKRYYLLTILAVLFHVSALINIVALLIHRRINDKNKRSLSANKLIFGTVILTTVVGLGLYGLQKYGYLFDLSTVTANLNFVPRLVMLLIVLSLWYSAREVYRKYRLFLDLGLICIVLGLIGFIVPYGDRLALYFLPFIIVLFPTAMYYLMPKSKKHLTILAVLFVAILYFVVSYYVIGSHAVLPYKSILGVSV
ncbi:EpsG family protein [Candidatus Saccharibacteria bacterium]|nr:EpsG family protein [Candidatus Saccharibacteria bacterium]MBH1973000.1 EpsG family protein [Candidatus Saccharibacteria bacterium]MBH1991203.1 EpsG family protein [Candidatus Saccharibacteria bacterium]